MNYGRVVGIGNTATVYEWEEGKVLKLFYQGYPKEVVENEFNNAKAISEFNFAKAKAYEMVFLEERFGIVYDRVSGESLLDWVMKTGEVQGCAVYMSKLHKAILKNRVNGVPDYKQFLKYYILKSPLIRTEEQKEALQMLDKLTDGNTLCHGDFHPGNIFISSGSTIAIDFMNVCHGDYLYDVARTVFLVEYTPVPVTMKDREVILNMKKLLSDSYLMQMDVTREMIQDYLSVIKFARLGECPDEYQNTQV